MYFRAKIASLFGISVLEEVPVYMWWGGIVLGLW